MTDNKKLIEEARRAKQAVYLATDASVADDLSRIIGGAADALEAAEKAHTPTDDDRKALKELLISIHDTRVKSFEATGGDASHALSAWDVEGILAGLRIAADSPRNEVAITRQRIVEAADALETACAALAVFEKAHAPTGDDREARLEYVIDAAVPVDEFPSWRFRYSRRIADAVLAAGFRLTEVPEPSGRMIDTYDDSELRTAFGLPEQQGEPADASNCEHCGGKAWHHTVECFTDTSPVQDAVGRLENCLSNREAGIGAWSMVQPEDVRTILAALRAAGGVR